MPSHSTSPPVRKRRRIALACTQCRLRKSKCDGAHPSCGYCSDAGIQCVYKHRQRLSRTSGTGEYDNRLKAIEETLHQLVRARDDRSDGQLQSAPSTGVALVDDCAHQELQHLNEESPRGQQGTDPATDGLATVRGLGGQEEFFGPSSNIAFLKAVSRATSAILRVLAARDRRLTGYHNQEPLTRWPSPAPPPPRTSHAPPSTIPDRNCRVLPAEAEATRLLQLYFSNTGVLFPFISEKQAFASYHAFRSQGTVKPRSHLCLLNAIFAFATIMESTDKHLDATNTARADVFYQRALSLTDLDNQASSDLETVQYLVLLSLYCQISQRPKETWKLHGLAIQSATQIGLFSNSVIRKFSGVNREVRKRLWYGCFILDRSLSMTLGRPFLIHDDLMSVEMPSDAALDHIANGPSTVGSGDCDEKDHSASFFVATIHLYKILGSIIAKLYRNNVDEELLDIRTETIEHIAAIEDDLCQWKRSLPKILLQRPWEDIESGLLSDPDYDLVSARLSSVTHLRFLNGRILLHRPVLQWFLDRKGARTTTLNNQAGVYVEMVLRSSVQICNDTATCIINLVWRLSSNPDLLGARWFSIYFTFNAALALFCCFLIDPTRYALGRKLFKAVEATERLENDTHASRRVMNILQKLIDISNSLGEFEGLVPKEGNIHDARPELSGSQPAQGIIADLDGLLRPSNESNLIAGWSGLSNSLDMTGESCSWDSGDWGVLWPADGVSAETAMMLGF